jgi:hypothetical protein
LIIIHNNNVNSTGYPYGEAGYNQQHKDRLVLCNRNSFAAMIVVDYVRRNQAIFLWTLKRSYLKAKSKGANERAFNKAHNISPDENN